MRFSRVLLAISFAAAVAMIVGYGVVQYGGPPCDAPAAFRH
jgi:hypothetical protein